MIISFDSWHKEWGFGLTLIVMEDLGEYFGLIRFDCEWQVKLFGRTWNYPREIKE